MGELVYQVMFMNGKAVRFYADQVILIDTAYHFLLNGDTVAEFNQTIIAGYMIMGVNDREI